MARQVNEGFDMGTLKTRCQQVSVSLAVDPAGAWTEVAMQQLTGACSVTQPRWTSISDGRCKIIAKLFIFGVTRREIRAKAGA